MNRRYGFGMRRAAVRSSPKGSGGPSPAPFYSFVVPDILPAGTSVTRASIATCHNSAGILVPVEIDTARFDHDPSTLAYRGLLLEAANTNLSGASANVSDPSWQVSRGAKTSTNNPDPAGGNGAGLFTFDGTSGTRSISFFENAALLSSGTAYTSSVFMKAGTQSLIQITGFQAMFGGGGYANFQLTGGGIIGTATVPAVIQAYPDGWYRLAIAHMATGTGANGSPTIALSPITSLSSGRVPSTTLNTTLLAWGGSVTVGGGLESYIPTTTTAATRAADELRLAGPAGAWRITFHDGSTQILSLAATDGVALLPAASLAKPWLISAEFLP